MFQEVLAQCLVTDGSLQIGRGVAAKQFVLLVPCTEYCICKTAALVLVSLP
jgi:hypothetical protein